MNFMERERLVEALQGELYRLWHEVGRPDTDHWQAWAVALANFRLAWVETEAATATPDLLAIVEGFLATLDDDNPAVEKYYNANIALWNAAIEAHKQATGEQE
jgi:hypothetical protein